MKFKDINPTVIELAPPYVFYRARLVWHRSTVNAARRGA